MKAKSLASYPSSPVTIQRHRNPRTVLHLCTGHSSMTELRMIDQLDNEPVQSKHWRQGKTRQTIFILCCWGGRAASCGCAASPWLRCTARSAARPRWTSPRAQWLFFVITVPMSTSSPLSWTLPVTVPPTMSIPVWCTYSGTLQPSDFFPRHQRQLERPEKQLSSTVSSPSNYLFR